MYIYGASCVFEGCVVVIVIETLSNSRREPSSLEYVSYCASKLWAPVLEVEAVLSLVYFWNNLVLTFTQPKPNALLRKTNQKEFHESLKALHSQHFSKMLQLYLLIT